MRACAADLGDGPRCGFDAAGPHRLNRVDDYEPRDLSRTYGCNDVFYGRLSGQLDWRGGNAQTLGAQAYLCNRLLTGDIDRAIAGRGQGCGRLDQQSRFSNSGIPADQHDRAVHKAASRDAVEFDHA
jgi:hypothetical protein